MQNDADKVLVWRNFNEKNIIYTLYNLLFLIDLFKTPTGSFNSLKPMVKLAIGDLVTAKDESINRSESVTWY